MTRETKIGLLVGLAFIIVIGILLSDHFSSAMKPPDAPVVSVGPNVRSSVRPYGDGGINGGQGQAQIPPYLPEREIQTQPRPPIDIRVVPPNDPPQPHAAGPNNLPTGDRGALLNRDITPIPPTPPVYVFPPPVGTAQPPTPGIVRPEPGDGPPPGTRKYVAERGDTVSKMAARFLGSNSKANQDAIIRLNMDLRVDANKVSAGQKYYIPVAPAAVAPTVTPTPNPVTPNPAPPTVVGTNDAPRPGEIVYTTKAGDNLWKIANEQCGGGSHATVNLIQAMNKEVLKGSIALRPNMKLRLPPRTVASTN